MSLATYCTPTAVRPFENGEGGSPHRTVLRTATEIASAFRPSPSMPVSSMGTSEEDRTAARFRALSIDTTPSEPKPCPCILDGHEQHKAVVFYDKRAGHWLYRCDELRTAVGLAGLRALKAGRPEHVHRIELVRWSERLDHEAGLHDGIALDVRLPEPCRSPSAPTVAYFMALLVGLRQGRGSDFMPTEPFTFGRGFAIAYTELASEAIRQGTSWLERHGVIYRVDDERRRFHEPILWKLAAQDSLPPLLYDKSRRQAR